VLCLAALPERVAPEAARLAGEQWPEAAGAAAWADRAAAVLAAASVDVAAALPAVDAADAAVQAGAGAM
jgi:hypothetical protein